MKRNNTCLSIYSIYILIIFFFFVIDVACFSPNGTSTTLEQNGGLEITGFNLAGCVSYTTNQPKKSVSIVQIYSAVWIETIVSHGYSFDCLTY